MNIKIVFAMLIVLFSSTTIACKKNAEIQKPSADVIAEKVNAIDSLEIDLNQDGKLDKILVIERSQNESRTVKILLKTDKGYKTIGDNEELVDCENCGYQSGDPYIDVAKTQENGFSISLENIVYSFIYTANQVVLDEIDLLQTTQTTDGVEEVHQIFTRTDFGVLNFNEIKNDLILKLVDQNKVKSTKNLNSSTANFFLVEKNPLKILLPFSFYEYYKSEYSKKKYPSYEPTLELIEFLKTKDYEGESYKCFVIRSDEAFFYLVAAIMRGDSEYFVLVTTQNNKIIDYAEIGSIGGDNPVTFKVSSQYIIEKFNGNGANLKPTEKLKIDNSGTIQKLN